ncbi:MAG: 2-oxoglutarate dehydrogenase E1 component [Chloroflexota bacterium]
MDWNEFNGFNQAYLLDLYEKYCENPNAVDAALRTFFDRFPPVFEKKSETPAPARREDGTPPEKVVAVSRLAEAIRQYGHFNARLDPLGSPPPGDPWLEETTYGLSREELAVLPAHLVGGAVARRSQTALQAIQRLRSLYSGTVGHDYLQIRAPDERNWLRQAVEEESYQPDWTPGERLALLERLTEVEVFERFLQRAFPGKTRFSIEGVDMLVPMLDELIRLAGEGGIRHVLMGMAHRGRLNVLAHVLGMPYETILAEFKDPLERRLRSDDALGFSGDVKYHLGGRQTAGDECAACIEITLAPNPSHLEAVNPVVEGMARAAGSQTRQAGPPRFDPLAALPVLIHGDAAFPGQGVVAETFNLYKLEGYHTGGTIHIITNNQLGFTTDPKDGRSTIFASDLAKGFRVPILHVNADDPPGCLLAIRLAWAYRQQFHRDVVIDLIGYRRHGHNEGDEPSFTQPRLYAIIEQHPTVRRQWAQRLMEREEITPQQEEQMIRRCEERLQTILSSLDANAALHVTAEPPAPGYSGLKDSETGISLDRLQALSHALQQLPENFHLHPKLSKARERRTKWMEDLHWPAIDWAQAEELALASILEDGIAVRMTGQDVLRGTFSQRHAALFDYQTGEKFIPLQHLPQAKAAFEIHNSPLSELAALGFEYGYSIQSPERLVIWEAQYGDFINGAQVIIDEFITTARAKWLLTTGLVLLLPHGFEGQGPDHSSGRLERILNLYAEENLLVVNCTTAAQYFHLLRRQAKLIQQYPIPLVVMTPKSLLRHPLVASAGVDFTRGGFQAVLTDTTPVEQVERVLLCSGKVAVDLTVSEVRRQNPRTAIVRLEQLAPFPLEELAAVMRRFSNLTEVRWVQEEPENMGAWEFVRPHIEGLWGKPVQVVSRPRSASPAEGSNALHLFNQQGLIRRAFSADPQEEE